MIDPVIVIPARSGSKRLPGKNLMKIGGKTLVRRCVETAAATNLGCVYINSNDHEIIAEGVAYGAHVYRRDSYLARDAATTEAVIADMARALCWSPDQPVILMQCTSPFTAVAHVADCWRRYHRGSPIATGKTVPSGAVYVFPAVLATKGMLFDEAIRWQYLPVHTPYHLDIDTQEDFDQAVALHNEIATRQSLEGHQHS